jgi:hypothetical protein
MLRARGLGDFGLNRNYEFYSLFVLNCHWDLIGFADSGGSWLEWIVCVGSISFKVVLA